MKSYLLISWFPLMPDSVMFLGKTKKSAIDWAKERAKNLGSNLVNDGNDHFHIGEPGVRPNTYTQMLRIEEVNGSVVVKDGRDLLGFETVNQAKKAIRKKHPYARETSKNFFLSEANGRPIQIYEFEE